MAITGESLLMKFLALMLINDPDKAITSIRGMVPTPNRNIYNAPSVGPWVVAAPANARYTKPHGSIPFNNPIKNKEPAEWRFIRMPNCCLKK